jgi:HD-like signal output (HDOD) protein
MTTILEPDSSDHLQRLLSGAQLPALPQSALRVLELSRDANNGPAEFATAIESDPGLATQVLKYVNSSYFGFAREISSVKLAITLVGVRTIKNFVLWSAVFSLVASPKCGPFDLKRLWEDSLRRAIFARKLGKLLGLKDAEDLFAAALLQDMAVPLLAKVLPGEYAELLEHRDRGLVRLSELEQQRFGWTHAEAAGLLAAQWNLPAEFIELVRGHADIRRYASGPMSGAWVVALSAYLPSASDDVWTELQQFEDHYRLRCSAGAPSVANLLDEIDHDFDEFAPVLKIPNSANWLARRYQAAQAAC